MGVARRIVKEYDLMCSWGGLLLSRKGQSSFHDGSMNVWYIDIYWNVLLVLSKWIISPQYRQVGYVP